MKSVLTPSSPIAPEGATAFPPPTPSLSTSLSSPKKDEKSEDMETSTAAEGEGGNKRKNHRNHYGPKKKKLNLHNCATRTLPVSAKTPVRILMELGQQQKFDIEYKFAEPVKIESTAESVEGEMDVDKKETTGETEEKEKNGIEKKESKDDADEVKKLEDGDEQNKDDKDGWTGPKKSYYFSCTATVGGESYNGVGHSKQLAKNMAAEEAIKALVLKVKESGAEAAPWSALACLGLYKVFTEWESQGVCLDHLVSNVKTVHHGHHQQEERPLAIPTLVTTLPEPIIMDKKEKKAKSEKKREGPKVAGKMPDDPTKRHPVQLLNELHPGLAFEFIVGGENNYDCKVNVEDMDFIAKGKKNKKEAKKCAAQEALRVLYNVSYPAGSQFG